ALAKVRRRSSADCGMLPTCVVMIRSVLRFMRSPLSPTSTRGRSLVEPANVARLVQLTHEAVVDEVGRVRLGRARVLEADVVQNGLDAGGRGVGRPREIGRGPAVVGHAQDLAVAR